MMFSDFVLKAEPALSDHPLEQDGWYISPWMQVVHYAGNISFGSRLTVKLALNRNINGLNEPPVLYDYFRNLKDVHSMQVWLYCLAYDK